VGKQKCVPQGELYQGKEQDQMAAKLIFGMRDFAGEMCWFHQHVLLHADLPHVFFSLSALGGSGCSRVSFAFYHELALQCSSIFLLFFSDRWPLPC
jgi:hypothetical protein